jgi:hypothetical protein
MLIIMFDDELLDFKISRLAVGMIKSILERLGDELLLLDDEPYPDVKLNESFGN